MISQLTWALFYGIIMMSSNAALNLTQWVDIIFYAIAHGLRTPNEGINQKYLKNWADVADKICFGRT